MLQRIPRIYRKAHRGGTRLATLLVLTGMATGGVYAYRHFFQRGGEAATQLIPGDALVVVTIDATPSAGQVGVFKRIADACKAEHLDTTLEDMIGRAQGSSPLARDVRPFAMGSAAYALLKPGANGTNSISGTMGSIGSLVSGTPQGDNAWFVAVSDANRVQEALNRDAQKNTANGLDYYTVGGETRCMAVMGNYLVTADKPEDLVRIEATRKRETPAISASADYQQARTALPSDSNMMLFVSAEVFAANGQNAQNANNGASGSLLEGVRSPMQRTRYMAMGFAIHDRGIDSVMLMPAEPPTGTDGQEVSHIAPFDTNLFSKMPGGAYGIVALSQPGKYYHYASALANMDSRFRQTMAEGVRNFERETGLNVTRDVLPGLNGNVALAIYPDADNPQQSVDGLLVMDDANGADPAALADRVRAYVERESTRRGGAAWRYTSQNRNGVLVWTLNPEAQAEIRGQETGSRGQGSGVRGQGNAPFITDAPRTGNIPDANPNGNGNNGQSNDNNNNSGNNRDDSNGNNGTNGADRRGGDGGLLNSGSSSRQSNDVNVHIHAGSDGRVYDDTFDLHHGEDRVRADRNGVDIHTGEGDSLRVNRNGLSIRSHDGNQVEIHPNGVDIQAHDNGNGQSGTDGNATSGSAANGSGENGTGQNGSASNGSMQNGSVTNGIGQNGPTGNGSFSSLPGGNVTPPAQPDAGIRQALRSKTVAYAQIGHALLVASSLPVLERAINAYQNGGGTMASDPGYGQLRQQIPAGAQNAILINLPAILEAARPTLTQTLGSANAGFTADDILHLAGDAGSGLIVTQQYDGNTFKATCFVPVNYEKAIHLVGIRH